MNIVPFEIASLLIDKGINIPAPLDYDLAYHRLVPSKAFSSSIPAPDIKSTCDTLLEKGFFIALTIGFPFIDGKPTKKFFWDIVRVHEDHLSYPTDESMADSIDEALIKAIDYILTKFL